jgi:phage tail sheath gpL-like
VARGLSTNREQIVAGIQAEIDSSNPGRINLLIPDVPSAGLRILAAKLEWAFVTG